MSENKKQAESVVYGERSDSIRVKNSHLSTREQSRREIHPFIRPWICSAIIGFSFLVGKNSTLNNFYSIEAALVCTEAASEASWIKKKPAFGSLSAAFFLIAAVGLFFSIKFLVKHPTVCFFKRWETITYF